VSSKVVNAERGLGTAEVASLFASLRARASLCSRAMRDADGVDGDAGLPAR
jgi:hypothetical protein